MKGWKILLKAIYIDFTSAVPSKKIKYHGGGSYTKKVLSKLNQRLKNNNNTKVFVLWPQNYEPQNEQESEIYNSNHLNIILIEEISDFKSYQDESLLFLPLLGIKNLHIVKKIKMKNPNLKISVTIHGLRLYDLKTDKFDKHYKKRNKLLKSSIIRFFAKKYYIYKLKRYLNHFDNIYTVSNNSLQLLNKYGKNVRLSTFYQDTYIDSSTISEKFDNDYILFVSANRSEKNFLRSLKAFIEYKRNSRDNLFLYATGINDEMKNIIDDFLNDQDKIIFNKYVFLFDYVSHKRLTDLYKQSKFLLFTSKSEGFGIPVMESIRYGRPVIASNVTSIPEVAGPSVFYVNPYSELSIIEGLKYMTNENNLRRYEFYVKKYAEIIKQRAALEENIFIDNLLNFN